MLCWDNDDIGGGPEENLFTLRKRRPKKVFIFANKTLLNPVAFHSLYAMHYIIFHLKFVLLKRRKVIDNLSYIRYIILFMNYCLTSYCVEKNSQARVASDFFFLSGQIV